MRLTGYSTLPTRQCASAFPPLVIDRLSFKRQARHEDFELRDVSLVATPGMPLGVFGPNGAGKTTLLLLIAGHERPNSGTIRLGDRLWTGLYPYERNIATVFQTLGLFQHLSAHDNLVYGLTYRALRDPSTIQMVKELSMLLSLDSLAQRKPSQLSTGEQQRIAIGRALVRRPSVLLLDEPTSSVDSQAKEDVASLLLRVQNYYPGLIVIVVSHDREFLFSVCPQLAVLDRGHLLAKGTRASLLQTPPNSGCAELLGTHISIAARQIGECRYQVVEDGFPSCEFMTAAPGPMPGGRVSLLLGRARVAVSLAEVKDNAFPVTVLSGYVLREMDTLLVELPNGSPTTVYIPDRVAGTLSDLVGKKLYLTFPSDAVAIVNCDDVEKGANGVSPSATSAN